MKVRLDFVTNSSSSSFVIALNPQTIGLAAINAFVACAGDYDETGKGDIISTKEEWKRIFEKTHTFHNETIDEMWERLAEDGREMKLYKRGAEMLDNGMVLIRKYVSYSAESLSDFITELAKNPDNCIILQND